jgi:hypothetical protein
VKRITALAAGAVIALAAGLGIAACGTTAATSSPPPAPPAAAAASSAAPIPAMPALTCADLSPAITKAVSDLKTEDAAEQEAWVTGGDSADLQALIDATANAALGADQLNDDASTFNTDATSYLSDNSPDLYPGWQTGYDQVRADINALATDCGLPTAPKPSFN